MKPPVVPGSQAVLSKSTIAFWERLHACEQPSGWHGGYPRYPGGLGIWYGNWAPWAGALGLLGRYPDGGSAPRLVQIRVADWAYKNWRDGNGRRPYWGCFAHVGYPPG